MHHHKALGWNRAAISAFMPRLPWEKIMPTVFWLLNDDYGPGWRWGLQNPDRSRDRDEDDQALHYQLKLSHKVFLEVAQLAAPFF
jgi:hypothetical protein